MFGVGATLYFVLILPSHRHTCSFTSFEIWQKRLTWQIFPGARFRSRPALGCGARETTGPLPRGGCNHREGKTRTQWTRGRVLPPHLAFGRSGRDPYPLDDPKQRVTPTGRFGRRLRGLRVALPQADALRVVQTRTNAEIQVPSRNSGSCKEERPLTPPFGGRLLCAWPVKRVPQRMEPIAG